MLGPDHLIEAPHWKTGQAKQLPGEAPDQLVLNDLCPGNLVHQLPTVDAPIVRLRRDAPAPRRSPAESLCYPSGSPPRARLLCLVCQGEGTMYAQMLAVSN